MPRPPAPPPHFIPSCIQVTLHWQHPGGAFSNVLHGRYGGTPAASTAFATTLYNGIVAAAQTTQWLTHVAPTVTFHSLSLKDLRTAEMPVFEYVPTTPAVGAATGVALPISVAMVVTHRTGQSGRQWRGRSFLGGTTDAALLNMRQFSTATGTDGVGFLTGIQNVFTTNGIPMVVAQPRLMEGTNSAGNTLAERPANVVNVTTFDIANARADTQRRRLGR
jgi:hypothetical protein